MYNKLEIFQEIYRQMLGSIKSCWYNSSFLLIKLTQFDNSLRLRVHLIRTDRTLINSRFGTQYFCCALGCAWLVDFLVALKTYITTLQ